jgi:PQQ-dependent catabolism-associated CXXCW motif protein
MKRATMALIVLTFPIFAAAQIQIPQISQRQSFSYEDKDWNVEVQSSPQGPPYGKPTPTSIPGARVVSAQELKVLLDAHSEIVVIDVLDNAKRTTIPGAYWLPGAGAARFYAAETSRFSAALEKLAGPDKNRPLVFLCLSSECWESYNASLHAMEIGYKDILWFRGGTNAWTGASFERKPADRIDW